MEENKDVKSKPKKPVLENIVDKLTFIQQNLVVGKDQYNSFGKFSYRTVSDVLIALKPLLDETACCIVLSDELVQFDNRYYVKATAKLIDAKSKEEFSTTAFAREAEMQSGMGASQLTGGASTYARKYALNGLLAIDDTMDPDSRDNTNDDKPLTLKVLSTGEIEVDTKPAAAKLKKLVKSGE